jgi:hypothetical protein
VRFLRRQLVERIHGAFTRVLARCLQLDPSTLRERLHPKVGEEVMGDPQLGACIEASTPAPEPLAVDEASTGEIDRDPTSTESIDRLHVEVLGSLIVHEERL